MTYTAKKGADSPSGASHDAGAVFIVDDAGTVRVVVRPRADGSEDDDLVIKILKLLNRA